MTEKHKVLREMHGTVEESFNRVTIDIEEFVKFPDWSNFSLIDGSDLCKAARIIIFLRTSDYTSHCTQCPMFMEYLPGKRVCVVGRSAGAAKKQAYLQHEGEVYLEIIKLKEAFDALLEELSG